MMDNPRKLITINALMNLVVFVVMLLGNIYYLIQRNDLKRIMVAVFLLLFIGLLFLLIAVRFRKGVFQDFRRGIIGSVLGTIMMAFVGSVLLFGKLQGINIPIIWVIPCFFLVSLNLITYLFMWKIRESTE